MVASLGNLLSEQTYAGFAGNVTDTCMVNGSWYAKACGPWGAEQLPYGRWRARGYEAGFGERDGRIFDAYAAKLISRSKEIGTAASRHFPELVQAAHNWEAVRGNEDEKAAAFVYHACRNYRQEAAARGEEEDAPSSYHMLEPNSVQQIAGQFLFESCKRFKFEVVGDSGRWFHQARFDVEACAADKVACKKDTVKCLGSCGGVDGSQHLHDFSTIVSLTELSEFVLGDSFLSAEADCTVRTHVFKVPTFAGGDSFGTFAARLRVRSGLTAIDNAWCARRAKSCAVVQRVLERSPQLTFVDGEFRHVMAIPPSPPPFPSPPPRKFAYAPLPPSPPPPPQNPPPYYANSEICIPLPRLADFGLDLGVDVVEGAPMEERASCLFVRRIADEKRRASVCFTHVSSPNPPPPAPRVVSDTLVAASLRRQRERLNDLEVYAEPSRTGTAKYDFDSSGALDGTRELISALGENNPILRAMLNSAMDEIVASSGRRLLQRFDTSIYMSDALITHEIMQFYGKGGIPGVTSGSCQALCEATKQDNRAKQTDQCNAYAFKRASPFSHNDKIGWCYMLQVTAPHCAFRCAPL